MVKAKLLIVILELFGLDVLIKSFIPEVQFIIWISFAVFFGFNSYTRMTNVEEREKLINIVSGSKLAFYLVIIGLVSLIFACIYLAFDAIDSRVVFIIKNFFIETLSTSSIINVIIGVSLLFFAYFHSQFNSDEAIKQMQQAGLNEGTIKKAIYEEHKEKCLMPLILLLRLRSSMTMVLYFSQYSS